MSTLKISSFIAYKSIVRGNKSTLALMIFILSLSFLNLMFISGILAGLSKVILQSVIDTTTSYVAISPQDHPVVKTLIPDQEALRTQIAAIPGIIATTREYLLSGSIAYDKDKNGQFKSVPAQLTGIDPDDEQKVLSVASHIVAGSFLSADDPTDQIVLGAGLSGGYGLASPSDLGGVTIGDKVLVTFSNGTTHPYTIKGIFDVPIGNISYTALISSRSAEGIIATTNSASQILVKTNNNYDSIDNYAKKIRAIAPNLRVQTYVQLLAAFGPILNAFGLISLIVSVISVAVAAITIFVLIYVNAVNKKRQIGILKAIGIKQNIIVYSYILQSIFYTGCGIILGSIVVFGILSPLVASHPIPLPFGPLILDFSVLQTVLGIVSLLLAGVFAGFLPARIVAKENILTAIWG